LTYAVDIPTTQAARRYFVTSASATDLPPGVVHGIGYVFARYTARFIRLMTASSNSSWYNMYDGTTWSGWVREAD